MAPFLKEQLTVFNKVVNIFFRLKFFGVTKDMANKGGKNHQNSYELLESYFQIRFISFKTQRKCLGEGSLALLKF